MYARGYYVRTRVDSLVDSLFAESLPAEAPDTAPRFDSDVKIASGIAIKRHSDKQIPR